MPDEELKRRLSEELRAAIKQREPVRVAALRLLTAAVKNREVELRRVLSHEEFVQVASREAKRRREAIDAYERVGREERADTEREELGVLEAYTPEPSDDEA